MITTDNHNGCRVKSIKIIINILNIIYNLVFKLMGIITINQ